MWTPQNRKHYDRSQLRYPSDLTDAEWAHIAPRIPPAKPGGNKRTVDIREVVNGVMYVLSTGCQWRALPKDLPPKSTVHDYVILWTCDGTLDRIHHALYVACRATLSTAPQMAVDRLRSNLRPVPDSSSSIGDRWNIAFSKVCAAEMSPFGTKLPNARGRTLRDHQYSPLVEFRRRPFIHCTTAASRYRTERPILM